MPLLLQFGFMETSNDVLQRQTMEVGASGEGLGGTYPEEGEQLGTKDIDVCLLWKTILSLC